MSEIPLPFRHGPSKQEKPIDELERLTKRSRMLAALEQAGVDNWEGYGYAMGIFYDQYPEYKDDD